jgi:hypothetical protein
VSSRAPEAKMWLGGDVGADPFPVRLVMSDGELLYSRTLADEEYRTIMDDEQLRPHPQRSVLPQFREPCPNLEPDGRSIELVGFTTLRTGMPSRSSGMRRNDAPTSKLDDDTDMVRVTGTPKFANP